MSSGAALAALIGVASAVAAECPRKDALGTSRVLSVDAKTTPRVGLKSFPQTLALADHEVVLTFDDGPNPPTTSKVLAALAQECVRATFFLIGLHASQHPDMVKRIAREGHTIGHHTFSHPFMARIPFDKAKSEVDRGVAAVEMALHGSSTATPSTPFFPLSLFPGDASAARPAPIPWHRRVRRGPLGQRLERDDAGAGIEAGHGAPRS
ncbi:hypothetical protein ABH979_004893 [Bradyrhizobium ottawaense]